MSDEFPFVEFTWGTAPTALILERSPDKYRMELVDSDVTSICNALEKASSTDAGRMKYHAFATCFDDWTVCTPSTYPHKTAMEVPKENLPLFIELLREMDGEDDNASDLAGGILQTLDIGEI